MIFCVILPERLALLDFSLSPSFGGLLTENTNLIDKRGDRNRLGSLFPDHTGSGSKLRVLVGLFGGGSPRRGLLSFGSLKLLLEELLLFVNLAETPVRDRINTRSRRLLRGELSGCCLLNLRFSLLFLGHLGDILLFSHFSSFNARQLTTSGESHPHAA